MRWTVKSDWLPLTLLAGFWAMALFYLPHLPSVVPLHRALDGRPGLWMPTPWAAIVGPGAATLIYLLHTFLPYGGPNRYRWDPGAKGNELIKSAYIGMFGFLTWTALAGASHYGPVLRTASTRAVALGLLFIVIGNYLPKSRVNFFSSFRGKWNPPSDSNRDHSNRFTGRLMFAIGIVYLLTPLFPIAVQLAMLIAGVALTILLSVAYGRWLSHHRQNAT